MAILAREFHIDPTLLTMDQFDGLLDALARIREAESGAIDHRTAAQRLARRRLED